ncbi:MAG TPA: hypothetical protein VLH35_05385 [Candidatus Acidoferrales bacterium]|nr:hypothetical protein [Candidatus Acidoferrales bacterium]
MPYPVFESDILKIFGLATIPVAIALVCLFFFVYRYQRSVSLLGLPVGFLFLAISFTFLGFHLVYPYSGSLSTSLMWLRVATQTWGFTLIAISYFFKNRTQMKTKYGLISFSLLSIAVVGAIFASLLVINPAGLSSVYADNSLFAVVNLGILTFIIALLLRKIKLAKGKVSDLLAAPAAFGLLWLGQLMFLLWDNYNGGYFCLLGTEVARLFSLVIFVFIYYSASKEVSTVDEQQTQQG